MLKFKRRCMLKFKRLACGSEDVTQYNTAIFVKPQNSDQHQVNRSQFIA